MLRLRNYNNSSVFTSLPEFFCLGLVLLHTSGCSPELGVSAGDELFQNDTRITWIRQIGGVEGDDPFCVGEHLVLMGRDAGGERRILPDEGNYRKPLITPDGAGIVFSSHLESAFYQVNWDGSALRKLGDGSAVEVWREPDGCTWVYYMSGDLQPDLFSGTPVMRCQLNDPSISEVVWEKSRVSADNFQLSEDGTKAAGLYPWTLAGVADLSNQTLHPLGKGCWTSISPDNRYLMWYFDGSHKKLVLRSLDGKTRRKIRINTMPEAQRHEVYHPRWSTHPRFFCMTGPYRQMGEYNAITGGGKGINIYVGRFDPDYKKVERWYQITDHAHADFYPDLWMGDFPVSTDEGTSSSGAISSLKPAVEWPENRSGLSYVWRDGKSINGIDLPEAGYHRCSALRKGKARYGRFHEMQVSHGYFIADGTDALLADAVQKSQSFTIVVNVRPALVQDEGEGAILAKGHVALLQSGTMLSLQAGAGSRIRLGELEPGQDHFIAITYSAESGAQFYHQGKRVPVPELVLDSQSVLKGFASHPLTFGGLASGQADWAGGIDGVGWYDRVLAPEEVAAMYEAYISNQAGNRGDAIPRLVVAARLVETSPMPTPEGIAPYRSALVEYLYEVEQVLEGQTNEKMFIVQHWAVFDATAYPLDREVGRSYRLALESINDHPELEGERISSELIEPVNIYLDVAWD